jgi:hypothetical protein
MEPVGQTTGQMQEPVQPNQNEPIQQQVQKPEKTSKLGLIVSIVSLVISGLGIISLCTIPVLYLYGTTGGGSGTAVTNEAVLGIAGIMFSVVCAWICGAIGGIVGIAGTIVCIVKKQVKKIWMPILSIVLGAVPFLGSVLLLFILTQL